MPKLSLIVIRTTKLDESLALYQKFGLQFTKEKHRTGVEHYSCTLGDTVLELYPLSSPQKDDARLGFKVSSVDSVFAEVQTLGVEVVSPTKDSAWGRRAVIKDFDGRAIEITE